LQPESTENGLKKDGEAAGLELQELGGGAADEYGVKNEGEALGLELQELAGGAEGTAFPRGL
jgi:hypothetical protein